MKWLLFAAGLTVAACSNNEPKYLRMHARSLDDIYVRPYVGRQVELVGLVDPRSTVTVGHHLVALLPGKVLPDVVTVHSGYQMARLRGTLKSTATLALDEGEILDRPLVATSFEEVMRRPKDFDGARVVFEGFPSEAPSGSSPRVEVSGTCFVSGSSVKQLTSREGEGRITVQGFIFTRGEEFAHCKNGCFRLVSESCWRPPMIP